MDSFCPCDPGMLFPKERQNMYHGQMELGLGTPAARTGAQAPGRRFARAQWWFERMRRIVDGAMDWQAAPPPRPEQMLLESAKERRVQKPNPEECLICE